jgi:carbon-monoxide dehydrogenase medium subunit
MTEFALDFGTSCLEPDELLTGITFPCWPAGHGRAFVEFAPRPGAYAIVSVAALIQLAPDGTVGRVSIGLSGVGPGPVHLAQVEARLVGQRADEQTLRAVAEEARRIETYEDARASAGYRRRLAETLTYRALALALKRARERNGHA